MAGRKKNAEAAKTEAGNDPGALTFWVSTEKPFLHFFAKFCGYLIPGFRVKGALGYARQPFSNV